MLATEFLLWFKEFCLARWVRDSKGNISPAFELGPGGRGGGAEHKGVLCGEWVDSVTVGVTRQPGNPVIYQWALVRD